jgi:hypothetical protein
VERAYQSERGPSSGARLSSRVPRNSHQVNRDSESAIVLRTALPRFANGDLKLFPILPYAIYPFADAKAAYLAVIGSSRDRIVFDPRR